MWGGERRGVSNRTGVGERLREMVSKRKRSGLDGEHGSK